MLKKMIILVVLGFSLLSCGGKQTKGNVLIVGTSADFPPFEFVGGEKGDAIIGFDMDIARLIADEMGKELKIEDMSFSALLPALASGKIDMVLSGVTYTPERAQSVDLSVPYYTTSQVALVKADAEFATSAELSGLKIAAQLGDTGEIIARNITGHDNVVPFDKAPEAVNELINSKVSAVILDEHPLIAFAQNNPSLKILRLDFEQENYVVAVKKGNTELLTAANKAILAAQENGTYEALLEKWIN